MPIDSKIHTVRLFQTGAQITRTLDISQSGHYSVHNLSPFLQDDSLRFHSSSELQLKKHTIHLALAKTEGLSSQEEKQLAEESRKKERLHQQKNALEKELQFWERQEVPSQPKDRDGVPVASNPELLLGALELQASRIQELQAQISELNQAIQKQNRILAPLEFLIQQRDLSLDDPTFTKRIELEVTGSGRLEISYFSYKAAWYPCYTLRLSEDYHHARLCVEAQIWQQTGEDWSGVEISLSTAQIQKKYELPKLQSRRIGRQEPVAHKPWIPPPVGTEKLFTDYDSHFSKRPKPPSKSTSQSRELREKLNPPPHNAFEEGEWSAGEDGATAFFAVEESIAPRPAPQMPPPPMPEKSMIDMPRNSRRKSASLLGAGMPLIRSAPPRGRANPSKKKRAKPREPALQVAEEELMDFHNIRMMDADHPDRGFLSLKKKGAGLRPSPIYQPSAPDKCVRPSPPLHFDYIYRASHPISLPSSNQFRKIQLSEEAADNQLVYISVPSKSQQVFRQIRLRNPLSSPLLKGPVDVYCGRSFLMQSDFEHTPQNGLFRFDLGVEANIRISRNLQSKESVQGMFIKEKEVQNSVSFEIKNLLSQDITVELLEVIPTAPEDSKIKVENEDASPPWNLEIPEDKPKGSKGWSFKVDAKTTQSCSYSYAITFPTDKELVGGNRRGS